MDNLTSVCGHATPFLDLFVAHTEWLAALLDVPVQNGGVISEHQYLNEVTVCRIEKMLAEHGDRELMEIVARYPDSSCLGFRASAS